MSNSILIVWMPSDQIGDEQAYRDYILESLQTGVLVLPSEVSCEVMELPPLGGAEVREFSPVVAPVLGPECWNTPASQTPTGCNVVMKRAIVQRLKAYRTAQGLGSLEALSVKTAHQKGKRVSAETLRNICGDGAPKMPLEDWLKIEKALNTLEQKGS